MPVGDVLVGDTGGDIEHDDTGLTVDVVTITETTELLLTSSVPQLQPDGPVFEVHGLAQKIDADRSLVGAVEGVVHEACYEGRFPDYDDDI